MTDKQIEKARKLRYKKALVNEINYDFIVETLNEIIWDCDEVNQDFFISVRKFLQ